MAHDWIGPLLGEERSIRRSNRVFPQARVRRDIQEGNDEVITTARPSDPSRTNHGASDTPQSATPSETPTPEGEVRPSEGVVRQWMSELAGATRPSAAGGGTIRVPSDAEVQTLTSMFPDIGRDVVLGVLQRR